MRYQKMRIHPWGVSYLHRRNPWVAAWWSAALPGLGHLYQGAYFKGFVLMSLEILINQAAHLNQAIHYTIIGQPGLAQQVLEMRFVLLYPLFYLLGIWDAYRMAVEGNRLYGLEQRQRRRCFRVQHLTVWGSHALVRRTPWVAVVMSIFTMGGGHFYNGQLVKAVILLSWHLAITIYAGLSLAFFQTLVGRPDLANQVIDYQWALFFPSLFLFTIWNAYVDCVELNRLHDEAKLYWCEQAYGPEN